MIYYISYSFIFASVVNAHRIERTVTGAESSNSQKMEKSKASALDNVLDTIKGPKTVNMVAKSGYDWDAYKEREGLEENLAVASKEG